MITILGDKEFQWSIEEFMDNPVQFIQEMDISAGLRKEQREQFILFVLTRLEQSWGKCSSSNEEVYKILAKLSCSKNSGKVVKQALQLLFHLICKDNQLGSGNGNLMIIEAIIRSSIFSHERGMFNEDEHSEQNLKLFVYNRILSLLLLQQVQNGELPIEKVQEDLKRPQKELRRCCDQIKNKKKDVFRYSMEFILKIISHFLKPQDKSVTTKIRGFLVECQAFCANPKMKSKDVKLLEKLEKRGHVQTIKNGEWTELHCILIYLHGKVQSERRIPQMETERRCMKLLRLIVEAYLQGGGGDDWRFCLLASSILSDITKNNMTKGATSQLLYML